MSRPRLSPFEAAVAETIRDRGLLAGGGDVLAAVSGGPDSTALVAVLAALREAGVLANVHACHVDHQLRTGSKADGDFCEALCAALFVPLQRAAVTVAGGAGVQAAARAARYRALRAAADACGATWIATGHTRADQAETVLHRLLRGAGTRGLAGIPPRRGRIVRPLLDRSRAEIIEYLRERGLSWREDPTNASPRFLRNRIRHEILPALDSLVPGIERRLAQTADLLREDDRTLARTAARAVPRGASGASVPGLEVLPLAVRRRAVLRLWRNVTGTRRHLSSRHVDAILRLLRRQRPARIALPRSLEARVAYGRLEIGPPGRSAAGAAATIEPVTVGVPGVHPLRGRTELIEITWPPDAPPDLPLEVRTRRPGDRFHPARAPGGKKLKAWLIDRKVPRGMRDALLVVAAGRRILALPELEVVARGAERLRVVLRSAAPRPGGQAPARLQPDAAPVINVPRVRR